MSGRRTPLTTFTPTVKCVNILFKIGQAVIRGEEYDCDRESYCQGLDEIELNRMVDRGELPLRKFKIVMEGYEYLCNHRRSLDLRKFRKCSCVQCSSKLDLIDRNFIQWGIFSVF